VPHHGAAFDLRNSTFTVLNARTALLHLAATRLPLSPTTFTHVPPHACDWLADTVSVRQRLAAGLALSPTTSKHQPNEPLRTFSYNNPRSNTARRCRHELPLLKVILVPQTLLPAKRLPIVFSFVSASLVPPHSPHLRRDQASPATNSTPARSV
jgi:hypothetical protein